MDGPAALSSQTLEGEIGLSTRGSRAPRDAAPSIRRRDAGVALPRAESARRTGRWACSARYLDSAGSFKTPLYRALYRQWLEDPTKTLWMAGSPLVADAIDRGPGQSNASSFHASTFISLPWLTSPDTNSRGRPGGQPRKMRLSPCASFETVAPRSIAPACSSHRRWPQSIRSARLPQ